MAKTAANFLMADSPAVICREYWDISKNQLQPGGASGGAAVGARGADDLSNGPLDTLDMSNA
jgi:hypothetical protein